MRMRFIVPTLVLSLGPRSREPRRMKIGPEYQVAHGRIGDGDVFQQSAIFRFQG